MSLSSIESIVKTGNGDKYELIRMIGKGRYGEVFEAFDVTNNKRCALKVLKPIRTDKVLREIDVLKRLNGGSNIIKLVDIVINNGIPTLVFRFVSHLTLKHVLMDFNEYEIKLYLFKLLRAIDFAHNCGIFHRDIKPSNVMIDRNRKILRLIDWGLADFYDNQKLYSVSVASRFYKSPELLLNNSKYDYSLDIWSFGCIVAAVLFRREPFFVGLDNLDQLKVITYVLGTKALIDYIEKYELKNCPPIDFILNSQMDYKLWTHFTLKGFEHLVNDIAIDFVDKLLVFDHKFRLTANEALSHPFFESVRNKKI